MKSKWAAGIQPRNFIWVIKGSLAVSERPGGTVMSHRRVRRTEEILWLKGQGFNRVISLMDSPHNLHAYDEHDLAWLHFPLNSLRATRGSLDEVYKSLDDAIKSKEKVLMHEDSLSDQLMGVVGAYLMWSGRLMNTAQAIVVVEQLLRHQLGPSGREIITTAAEEFK